MRNLLIIIPQNVWSLIVMKIPLIMDDTAKNILVLQKSAQTKKR